MKPFQNETETLAFLQELLKSNFWEWIETVLRGRENTVYTELLNSKTSADGRAMLTGRLLELRYLLSFPMASLQFFKGQEEAAKLASQEEREELISKVAFHDVITH